MMKKILFLLFIPFYIVICMFPGSYIYGLFLILMWRYNLTLLPLLIGFFLIIASAIGETFLVNSIEKIMGLYEGRSVLVRVLLTFLVWFIKIMLSPYWLLHTLKSRMNPRLALFAFGLFFSFFFF